ncbi:MAG: SCP2 sterol-binding domain-containing protein [Anaerolineae bacterium]
MPLKFPSDEWIKELSNRLNESETYEQSAKDWEGDIIFVVEPDDAFRDTAYLFLSLYHGRSPDAAMIGSEDEREAEFVISAPFSAWRQVIEGKLDPIQGMMTRRLKVKGNLIKITRYVRATQEMVACCARVETDFSTVRGM